MPVSNFGDFRDGLHCASFVIGMHDGDENGLFVDSLLNLCGINAPVPINGQVSDAKAVQAFEGAAAIDNRRVFCHLRNDVVTSPPRLLRQGNAANGKVITFRATTSKRNFVGLASQHIGHLLPGRHDDFVSFLPVAVGTRWIAKPIGKALQHCLEHRRVNRGGCVIIEIDRAAYKP
jgi:hypothetical protein